MKPAKAAYMTKVALVFAAALIVMMAVAATASAGPSPAAAWKIEQTAMPTHLEPGSSTPFAGPSPEEAHPKLRMNIFNVGGAAGEEVVVTDVLPAGLKVQPGIETRWKILNPASPEEIGAGEPGELGGTCSVVSQSVTCKIAEPVLPGTPIGIFIGVEVTTLRSETVTNSITVESAGTSPVQRDVPIVVSEARAPFGFAPAEEEGSNGGAFDQAGGSPKAGEHPFQVELATKVTTTLFGGGNPFYEERPSEPLRRIEVDLPPGLVVNPRAVPIRCSRSDFELGEQYCPYESQVGIALFDLVGVAENVREPLYVLTPDPGVPAELGFSILGNSVTIQAGLSGNFQLTSSASELLSRYPLDGVRIQLWGVPSDSRHDRSRASVLNVEPHNNCIHGCSARPSLRPFLTMPSSCSPSLEFESDATSWVGSEDPRRQAFETAGRQTEPVEGCGALAFEPSVKVDGTSSDANSPSGLNLDLKVPQNESLGGLASATVKKVSVQLPPGMTVNPPSANGLAACSVEQIGIGNNHPANCPGTSKIGTAEVVTPLLEQPLKGSLYLAEQRNNPFGTLLALYLVVEGEGVVIKLPGRVDANAVNGQLTATFDENPQLPFSDLNVSFNSGPRAPLTTPACGTYNVRTELTSWASSNPKVLSSPIRVEDGCKPAGFSPSFASGTANPVGGSYSPFSLRVTREDGEQNLSKISATLPEGLLAKLAGVPLCPEGLAASGNCPSASQVGSTLIGVGTGSLPLYIPQPGKSPTAIYLAGPYNGAPYSLVVKVPAQAGPFNLGNISVRVALKIDPSSTQVTAVSDPLPQILEGIPVAYRDVRVNIDRANFIVNPTNCEPMRVDASLVSITGALSTPSARFQAASCASLKFRPKLQLSLKGSTKRTGLPAVKAVVTYPKNGAYANIARAQVNLPQSEFFEQGNLDKVCTKPVLLEGMCPQKTIYGTAKAWTPLLETPLEGPVYLVGGFGYKLPALVADLNGQIQVLLKGKVDSGPNHGIRNTFEAVPDAPVSRFVLELKGGRNYGLLINSENLCKKPQHAIARFTAQNGLLDQTKPAVQNQCGAKGKKNKPARNKKK